MKDSVEIEHDRQAREFQAELHRFLEERWGIVGPSPGDGLDDEDREALGPTYLSGWVLVVSASSTRIEPDLGSDVEHVRSSFTMNDQLPPTTTGLLAEALRSWGG